MFLFSGKINQNTKTEVQSIGIQLHNVNQSLALNVGQVLNKVNHLQSEVKKIRKYT